MDAAGNHIDLSSVLIVEDDRAMQRRLRHLLAALADADSRITIVGNLVEAHAHLEKNTSGLVLVDIGLPDGSGIELIAWLHVHHPQMACVVISAWGHEDTVLAALRAGAIGYLLKEREDAELIQSLQSIRRGGAPIDPNIARRILDLLKLSSDSTAAEAPKAKGRMDGTLSDREFEILQMVARGYSNREIAELTSLSRFTVEGYTKAIYRKLAVSSRTAAVFEAQARGLLH